MSWNLFIPIILVSTIALGLEAVVAMRDHPAARKAGVIAAFGIAAFPVAIVVHNVLSAFIGGEEVASFILAVLVAPTAIAVGTLGVAFALLRDRRARPLARGLLASGLGLALLAAYMLFALAVTWLAGANPYQRAVEVAAMLASGAAIVGGVLYAGAAIVSEAVTRPRASA